MISLKRLTLVVACLTVALASPLHPEEGAEEDHGLFLSNDSSATVEAVAGAKNASMELSNDTMAANASAPADANATMAPDHLERSENATVRLADGDQAATNGSSATVAPPAEEGHKEDAMEEGHKEDAVEEAEDATKNLAPEDRNSSRLFNQTKSPEETPLDGDDKAMEEPEAKAVVEDAITTEKSAAGLKDDEDGPVVSLTTTARPLTLSAHPLEKEEEEEAAVEPSVLHMHPVLKKNRTIHFRASEEEEWRPYADNMADFLSAYSKEAQERNVHCDFEKSLPEDQACRFDLVYLGPSCTKENNFGYGIGKPCVLLSPGHFADWVPSPYDNDTMANVPDEVQRLMRVFNADFLFITCEGESESDRANIGPMAYLPPYQGFPSYFFPNKKDTVPNYVAPLMAIEFLNPTNGTLINVMCKAWAKNVQELPQPATLRFSLQVN